MKNTTSTIKLSCLSCASRCGMILHTDQQRLIKVEGDKEHPVSRGWSCSTGRASMVERHKNLKR